MCLKPQKMCKGQVKYLPEEGEHQACKQNRRRGKFKLTMLPVVIACHT